MLSEQSTFLWRRYVRQTIFLHADWPAIQPIDYLSPFLRVIKAPETSGKLTAAALRAVKRILDNDVLGNFPDNLCLL